MHKGLCRLVQPIFEKNHQANQTIEQNFLSIFIATNYIQKPNSNSNKTLVCDLEIMKQEAINIEDNLLLSGWYN